MCDTCFGVTDPLTRKESRVRAHMCEKPNFGLSFKRALCVLANNSKRFRGFSLYHNIFSSKLLSTESFSGGEYFQNVDDV